MSELRKAYLVGNHLPHILSNIGVGYEQAPEIARALVDYAGIIFNAQPDLHINDVVQLLNTYKIGGSE